MPVASHTASSPVCTTPTAYISTLLAILVAGLLVPAAGCAGKTAKSPPKLGKTRAEYRKSFGKPDKVFEGGKTQGFNINGKYFECYWEDDAPDSRCETINVYDVPRDKVEKFLKSSYSNGTSWGKSSMTFRGVAKWEDWVRSDGVVARWFNNGFGEQFSIMTPSAAHKNKEQLLKDFRD